MNEISTAERGFTGAGAEPDEGSARRPGIRVLVVEDDAAVSWGLLALLEEQPDLDVAALATTADVAVAQARHEAVDVAVVD